MNERNVNSEAMAKILGISVKGVARAARDRRFGAAAWKHDGKWVFAGPQALAAFRRLTDQSRARPARLKALDSAGRGTAAAPQTDENDRADLEQACAAVKLWDARMRELKYRVATGELVPAASVRADMVKVFSSCRTKLLGVPSQAKQALPHLSIPDLEKLGEIVRDALEGLADGEPSPPEGA